MLNALESAHILGLLDSAEYRKGKVQMKDSLKDVKSVFTPATEGIIFQKKPNVKNIEKWDTNPRDCILYAFTRVNNKSLDNLCNNHDREIVELDINDLDPWDGEMDEKIMDVRQSQYRDIYNALAKVPFIKELLTVVGKEKKELDGREVRRIDELHTNCCFVEGPTRAKLIKDISVVLRPLGSKYRFVLKGLDRRDIRLVSGLDTLPFVIRKDMKGGK